jgi:hypothetical protein
MTNKTEQLCDTLPKQKGRTLIVGSCVYHGRVDRRLAYNDAVGIDMIAGEGVDYVLDLESDINTEIGMFNHIECCSVLEHSKKPWALAQNIESLLLKDGTLFIAAPFVWRVHAYPDDYFRFTINGIKSLFNNIEWTFETMTYFEENLKPIVKINGAPYLARAESICFGHKI